MLDENLPTFYFKPSSDNPLSTTVFLSQNGSELIPEYAMRRPDPKLPASQNCYAIALYDSYNPEVLFAEVLVEPEWQQPTLSSTEIRAQNGIAPPPVPIVPEKFAVQLYNPDQQVSIKQMPGSWNSSAYWEFEMPQTSFRQPSVASIDRTANDPVVSEATPKLTFKWKRDGKLSKDISCFMTGKNTNGKKQKEPDILCAMLKSGNLTLYQPNMSRVDIEDVKGLEVVLILSSSVIKDIYFQPNKEMFNISPLSMPGARRKNSGPAIGGKPMPPTASNNTPPMMSGGYIPPPPPPLSTSRPQQTQQYNQTANHSRPSPTSAGPKFDPRKQWEIDAETERLRRLVEQEEQERARREAREQKKIKKMLDQEEKERAKRDAEIAKETERLRKQYGMPSQQQQSPPPRVSFSAAPPMPPRPSQHTFQQPPTYGRPQGLQHYQSAPHSQPTPVQRPLSTPNGLGSHSNGSTLSGFNLSSLNNLLHNGVSAVAHGGQGGGNRPPKPVGSPYLQAPGQGGASSSGFFGLGGRNKIQKKRSVYF